MATLTLLAKAANSRQLTQVKDILDAEFENLDAQVEILGNQSNKWIQVSISGEDQVIAENFINKKIGTCPGTLSKAQELVVLKGYISKVDLEREELKVGVGVFDPKVVQATVSLDSLRTQLADGKKVGLKQIAEVYGLRANLPLSVGIVAFDGDKLNAELSSEQLDKMHVWTRSLLHRLIVLGSSLEEIERVLERTHLNRDVIDKEVLGLFEYALICKLGTGAAGLVPRVGGYLKHSQFVVFNPEKVVGLIGEMSLSL